MMSEDNNFPWKMYMACHTHFLKFLPLFPKTMTKYTKYENTKKVLWVYLTHHGSQRVNRKWQMNTLAKYLIP